MSVIIYIPAAKARQMLASGKYVTLVSRHEWYPAAFGAQTFKTRLCANGNVRDVVFWDREDYERAKVARDRKGNAQWG